MGILYICNVEQSEEVINSIHDALQEIGCLKMFKRYADGDFDVEFFKDEHLEEAIETLNHKPFGDRPLNLFNNDEM